MSEPGAYARISIEQIAQFPLPGTVAPASLRFTPDGKALTYLFSAEGSLVRSLWSLDLATGARTVLAGPPSPGVEAPMSRDEELRRERARLRELGVTAYERASKSTEPVLLVPLGGMLLVRLGDGDLVEVPGCAGAIDPHLSPDGRRVAFCRGGDLFAADLPGGPVRQLTTGAEDGFTNGLAEFIAQEELDRSRGFWWNPAGTHIAFERADERHIRHYPIVHQGLDRVDVEHHRYPFAGEANAVVRLGVVEVASGEIAWMDLGPDPDIYLARVHWRPDGVLAAEILNREQTELRIVCFEAETPRTLLVERSTPWLNLSNDTRFLENGEILLSSERTGFRHLYVHAADGVPLRALTEGDWVVTRLVQVDQPAGHVYFTGTRDGVAQRHLYRVPLAGGPVERLTTEPGWHDPSVSASGGAFVDVWSSRELPPRVVLHRPGAEPEVLFGQEGLTAAGLGLTAPELVTLPAPDGTPLHGLVYRPPSPPPTAGYPCIVSVYGGPHAQRATDAWGSTVDLRAQYLAQRGFVVLKLDNRGSANRGLAFEAPVHRCTGRIEVEDQAAAVEWLVANHGVDRTRVGVYGWSYGGYMTLMCLCRRPDLFRAGVAGAPVTHWDGYDTGYTERYMSTPAKNPEGYRDSAVMPYVGALSGSLMLVHGMVDENVHFRHTARLAVALAAAQKPYTLLAYPEERHMPRDAHGLEYQERQVLGFLERHLAPSDGAATPG